MRVGGAAPTFGATVGSPAPLPVPTSDRGAHPERVFRYWVPSIPAFREGAGAAGVVERPGYDLRVDATAVILAGGGSRRMGRDKSMLSIGSRPMIAHIAEQLAFFPERLVGANDREKYAFLGLEVVPDEMPGVGPLMGIISCVARASYELSFVTGCDIPVLDRAFILRLLANATGNDIVMAQLPDGRVEPLLAVYRKTVVPVARELVARSRRRIVELFDHLKVHFEPAETLDWYRNLNTMREYHQFIQGRGDPHDER